MSKLCIIQGCPGNTRNKKRGEKIYYFKALEDQLEDWSRVIPGNYKIKIHDRVCSRHFKDDDLIKEWNFVIDDKTVTMPRSRWTLRVGAVPAIFNNYKDDLRVSIERKSKPKSLVELCGSSSDEEPRRKRVKKLKRTHPPRAVKKSVKLNPKTLKTGSKSCTRSSGKILKELRGKSANQAAEVSWEKACDNFVDQLSSLCAQTPARRTDAKPAKRRRGRPRKEERRSSLVSQTPSSLKNATWLKRGKSFRSGVISGLDTENSVIIEEFVASGCDDTVDIEILNDPDSSSQVTITDCQLPSKVAVKTEKCDHGYGNCDSVANSHTDSCIVTSSPEDSNLRHGHIQESEWNYEGVAVKREMCDCEGRDSCCEPQPNYEQTVLELPATPIPCEETFQQLEESQVDHGIYSPCLEPETDKNELSSEISVPEISIIPVSVSRVVHKVSKSQHSSAEVISEPHLNVRELGSQVSAPDNCHKRRMVSESQVEPTGDTTQCSQRLTGTPTPTLGFEKLVSKMNVAAMNVEENLAPTSMDQQQFDESSDLEMGFQGFSSDEEEDLISKRNYFHNTVEMAEKSTKLYLRKLSSSVATTSVVEPDNGELSPRTRRRVRREQRSSVEIAVDQLNDLESMMPVRSKKPVTRRKKDVVKDSTTNIQEPSGQEGEFSKKSDSLKERLAPDFRCGEVFKCGRISDEVTVTKASNLGQRFNKVTSVSGLSLGLDKVTSSSNHILLTEKSSLKRCLFAQSSKAGLISNKVSMPSNYDLLSDKVTMSSNHDLPKDKVATSSNHLLLKDKVTISSNHELFKDKGTLATETEPVKEKVPTNYSGPFTSKLSHLVNGSSLDRILQSAKGSSLLDSVTSTSTCDPSVDKTSLILKNFKSDGVLALECVVLKEQVRQLQKELFLHKQMLVDSEHNASLLQRKLELQAQLPCAKCVNFKRGFIGKETLI